MLQVVRNPLVLTGDTGYWLTLRYVTASKNDFEMLCYPNFAVAQTCYFLECYNLCDFMNVLL